VSRPVVAVLAGPGASTRTGYRLLAREFEAASVILEAPAGRGQFLARRVKHYGLSRVVARSCFASRSRRMSRLYVPNAAVRSSGNSVRTTVPSIVSAPLSFPRPTHRKRSDAWSPSILLSA
jgi:hypothetical protein